MLCFIIAHGNHTFFFTFFFFSFFFFLLSAELKSIAGGEMGMGIRGSRTIMAKRGMGQLVMGRRGTGIMVGIGSVEVGISRAEVLNYQDGIL